MSKRKHEQEPAEGVSCMDTEPFPPFKKQHQDGTGLESEMDPRPRYKAPLYKGSGKLLNKVAIITGGDSGIGRAVAVLFAREGCDVTIGYLPAEQTDADETKAAVEEEGRRCLLVPGDLAEKAACEEIVERTVSEYGKVNILVNNAAHQNSQDIYDLTDEEWDRHFKVNIYAQFRIIKAVLPHLEKTKGNIVTTGSIVGTKGIDRALAYGATKGAVHEFMKSLCMQLQPKGIRVNVVAPGPVWTPLNCADAGMTPDKVAEFGKDYAYERPAQPEELAPSYVFLASDADASYISGSVLHVHGAYPQAG